MAGYGSTSDTYGSLTVTYGDGGGPPPTATLVVVPAITAVVVGDTVQFLAKLHDPDGVTVTDVTARCAWVSSNPSFATVVAGLATGVAEGSVTITATDAVSSTAAGASLAVSAAPPPPDPPYLTISPPSVTVFPDDVVQVTCLLFTPDSSDITASADWDTSDAGVATVVAGLVTGVGVGEATITATDVADAISISMTVSVVAVLPGPFFFTPPAGDPIGPISMYGPTIRANPLGTRLMAHFRATATSVNVYKLADGTYTEVQPTPSPVNHAPIPDHQRIIHFYRGGTTETVSAAEKLALEAAGYQVDTV
jgi:hypothetical protein